jgi:methionyl-tRNA formyltransferase
MTGRHRVLLIGYGPTTETALESLMGFFDVIGIVRDAPDPDDPVWQLAAEHDLTVYGPRPRKEVEELITLHYPDAVVISSYNRVLGPDVLRLCPFVNVHYAPLPRYRGNAPVNWAIINGEPSTAITLHLVDPGLDSGNILYQESVPIGADDTATTLFAKLNAIQAKHLGPTVARVLATGWRGEEQVDAAATYGCARMPEDGEIRWDQPAEAIGRLVRALAHPFPGAFTFHEGGVLLVHHAEAAPPDRHYVGAIPGRVVRRSIAEGWVEVLTGRGILRVHEVARPGEAMRRAADLIRSTRAKLGLGKLELLRRIADLEARLARLEADNRGRPGAITA